MIGGDKLADFFERPWPPLVLAALVGFCSGALFQAATPPRPSTHVTRHSYPLPHHLRVPSASVDWRHIPPESPG